MLRIQRSLQMVAANTQVKCSVPMQSFWGDFLLPGDGQTGDEPIARSERSIPWCSFISLRA